MSNAILVYGVIGLYVWGAIVLIGFFGTKTYCYAVYKFWGRSVVIAIYRMSVIGIAVLGMVLIAIAAAYGINEQINILHSL